MANKFGKMIKSIRKKEILIPLIDSYLLSHEEESDRLRDINAPSSAGGCLRARYYSRTGVEEKDTPEARAFRIFQNGDHMHDRLQTYLEGAKVLLMREAPLRNDKYQIQGHTDGLLSLAHREDLDIELAVLELKSINDRGFGGIVKSGSAKSEHIDQALTYLYCLRERQKFLWENYGSLKEFNQDDKFREKYYRSLYTHLKDGRKYTRDEKVEAKIRQHDRVDRILFNAERLIQHVIFLYEDKDNQELFEYTITYGNYKERIKELLQQNKEVNHAVKIGKAPPKEGNGKSDPFCQWCNYRIYCWN